MSSFATPNAGLINAKNLRIKQKKFQYFAITIKCIIDCN